MGGTVRGVASIAVLVHLLGPSEGFRALGLPEINNRPSQSQWRAPATGPDSRSSSTFNRPGASPRLVCPPLATSPTSTSTPTTSSTSASSVSTPPTSKLSSTVTTATTTAVATAAAASTTIGASPASFDTLGRGGGGVQSPMTDTTTTVASELPPRQEKQQQQGLRETVEILGQRFERWKGTTTTTTTGQLSDAARDREKPLLLYLPGIEGLGTSIETQLPALAEKFRVFRLIVGAQDRSTFSTLAAAVAGFVDLAGEGEGEKTVVLGESFGGMLGLRLGQLRPERVQAVFAVNPATSFGRTPWRSLGPLLSLAPKSPYKAASIAVFAATIPDRSQVMGVMDVMFDRKNGMSLTERPKALAGKLGELWEMISEVSENLPPATLRWRIQNWMSVGQGRVERGLPDMKVPVTVIAGSADRLLPSLEEAVRLENLIPGCRRIVLEGHGHAPLFDGRVDISEMIKSDPGLEGVSFPNNAAVPDAGDAPPPLSGIYTKDWVNDFVEPDKSTLEEGKKSIDFLLKSVSPVFFSTRGDGASVSGLSGVPDADRSRPIVFIGNHQLFGLDLSVIVERLVSEKGILARGLAHPVVFRSLVAARSRDVGAAVDGADKQIEQNGRETPHTVNEDNQSENNGRQAPSTVSKSRSGGKGAKGESDSGDDMLEFFTKFGAVPVSPRNMYRLLKRGDNVLLFPGGVSEALHKKGEEYKVLWPEKAEFVRLAAASGAIIVPFSAVGIADSLEMVIDGDQLQDVPYVGDRLRAFNEGTPPARNGGDFKERVVPPFVLPKIPSRVYVRFGEAVSLEGLDKSDRAACQDTYERVKEEVELGIDSLLRAREQDPYFDTVTRLLYERLRGEPAPTFPAPVLDAAVTRAKMSRDVKKRRQSRRHSSKTREGDPAQPSTG